ncbi:hypothetical protein BGZ82_002851 [Podila clonocystis]|nr:hypothetical protein BGZ82_002851 [Podila clonocystis]
MSTPKSSRKFVPLPGQEYATPVPPYKERRLDPTGKTKMPSTTEELEAVNKPRVLISGGGIGGLTMAILLHKANIPFLVLERAKEIKPLGSAMAIGAAVSPLFKQLGIYDEFVKRAKYYHEFHMHKEDLELVHTMDFSWLTKADGFGALIISRPEFYDVLFNSLPRERILLDKRVLSVQQNEDSVMVRCADNSSYHGDILIGADGAYSAVRQNLYKSLKKDKKLPASDDVSLPFSCVCLVGQTVPLDPEEFPQMKEELAQNHSILGVSTMCTRNDSFRNSEWGPEVAEALAREVRDFKVPGGKDGKVLTLGDYIDKTPRDLMSKVMLEEIVFNTWYGGRTVLLGDACHKMNPTGASGAVTAIHDAVTLANWLSTLRFPGENEIKQAFLEYRTERYPAAKAAFKTSQMFTHNLGKNLLSIFVRGMMKRLPRWLWRRICGKMAAVRPQASFLPLIEDSMPNKAMYQRSLHKTLAIHKEEESFIVATGSNVQ